MKMRHEYLATSLWYKEEIADPYQVIAEFFFGSDIASYRKGIKDILMVACSDQIWKKSSPGELLYDFKRLESVINAAYLINKEKKISQLDIHPSDALNPNLYCGWHATLTEWDFFPRILSLKEYMNPYLVFKRFFKYQELSEWKRELNEVLEYALLAQSILCSDGMVNLLSMYFQLTKLIEAAHLIDVREINHIGGAIKNRIKKIY